MQDDTLKTPGTVQIQFLAGSRKSTTFIIDKQGAFRIGRDPECEIHVSDSNVSRVHAKLTWNGLVLVIEDLASTNGIFVNGEKVPVFKIREGDVVTVGATVFRTVINQKVTTSTVIIRPKQIEEAVAAAVESEQVQPLFECMLEIQKILGQDSETMIEESLGTLFLALPVMRMCLLRVGPNKEFETWYTRSAAGTPAAFTMSTTFARKVLDEGKGILLHDAKSVDPNEWGHTIQQQDVRTIIGVPVFENGAIIAILLCDNLERPNILTSAHVRTLEFFARALETVFQRIAMRRLEAQEAKNEREFLAARRVQKQIFTKVPKPEMGGLQWVLHYQPALQVGGDFYDFHEADDGITWIAADVAGKGVSAALVVSMIKAFTKTLLQLDLSPLEILSQLNTLLTGELPAEMFLTGMVCRTDRNGVLSFANAGHQPVLVIHKNEGGGVDVIKLKLAGVPIGFLTTAEFTDKIKSGSHQLSRNDLLCFYTDGVTEAANQQKQFYREERLVQCLKANWDKPLAQTMQAVNADIAAFRGTAPQHDDITLILGRY